MTNFCIPKYFSLRELVPPSVFSAFGERAWQFLDPHMLWTLDELRKLHGIAYVNNWHMGGNFQFSGLRPFDCAEGAACSLHKFGKAFDIKFAQTSAEEVRQHILHNADLPAYQYITCIEMNVGWLHMDNRNHNVVAHGIKQIHPN